MGSGEVPLISEAPEGIVRACDALSIDFTEYIAKNNLS